MNDEADRDGRDVPEGEPTEPIGARGRIARTSAYYDRYASNVAGRLERRDLTRAFDAFTALVVPGRPVLDVGSGVGAHLEEFARRGVAALGIEPSARMRELSAARGMEAIDGSFEELERLRLPEAGGVWCVASLLHVPKAEIPGALRSLERIMAPLAPLFATVRLGAGASWDRFDVTDTDDARFIQLFDDGELTAMIAAAGLDVLDEWTEESTWGRPSRWVSILARKPG